MADEVITIPCSICQDEISLPELFLHKKQHVALCTLGFPWKNRNKLAHSDFADHREDIITRLLSLQIFNEKTLQNVNDAFELLWNKQWSSKYMIADYIQKSAIQSEHACHLLIKGVAICSDRNTTWKESMHDRFTIVNDFGNKPNVCFLGLFDGHHGVAAADLTAMELPILLLHQLAQLDPSYQMTPEEQKLINSFCTVFRKEYLYLEEFFSRSKTKEKKCEYMSIHKAFAKAFWRMDRLLRLGRKEESRVWWSGCSAVTCLLEGKIRYPSVGLKLGEDENLMVEKPFFQKMPQIISGVLHVANTGNVEALLCRNGKGFCLTKEHTTRNIHERRRVLQKGAVITSNEPYGLIEGQARITRGLGFHGNPKLKKVIIPAPQTISVPIDDLCQFLILATNGLWEVLDKKEVTALAITVFQEYKETYHSYIQKRAQTKGSLLSPHNESGISKSSSNKLHQSKSAPKSTVSTINTRVTLSDSTLPQGFISNSKNTKTLLPKITGFESEPDQHSAPEDSSGKEQETSTQNFYKRGAEYISHELVNAALAAGSRDNITVMVILFSGMEYQFYL